MHVVDFHSHFFSAPFFEALAAASPQPGTVTERLERVAGKVGLELPSADVAAHTQRWVAELDEHGVDHLVTFASLPEETQAVAQAVRAASGRLTGIALVNPCVEGAAARTTELLSEGSFRGILLFPAMHHFSLSGPQARAVFEAVAACGGIVYVHCGMLVVKLRDLLGLPRPFDLSYANPLDLIPAANAFPETAFIIPHFGAGLLRETLMAGTQCANIHVDTSSTNSWVKTNGITLKDAFAQTLAVLGPERILFGTDSNVFPAGWRAERLDEQRTLLGELGASEEDCQAIFAGNARRLLFG